MDRNLICLFRQQYDRVYGKPYRLTLEIKGGTIQGLSTGKVTEAQFTAIIEDLNAQPSFGKKSDPVWVRTKLDGLRKGMKVFHDFSPQNLEMERMLQTRWNEIMSPLNFEPVWHNN